MANQIETRPTGPAAPLPPPRPAPRRSPRGVRVLWKVFAGVLVLAALVWGPYQVVTLVAHEERIENESFEAAGIALLEIDGNSGSIDIVASDRTTIEVRAEISDGLRRTGESRQVVGETLQLRSTCPNFGSDFCWVDYEVRVPRDLEVRIEVDNGSIRLDGVSGPLQLSTDNGSIQADRLRSSTVVADSDNGRVQLVFVAPPTTVVATTDNGRVEVVVPDDQIAYNVDVSSDAGRETTAVPTDPDSDRTITIRTDHGSATARTG